MGLSRRKGRCFELKTQYCYVCKSHVELKTTKEDSSGMRNFHACGHDGRKVKHLQKGLVGTYDMHTEKAS